MASPGYDSVDNTLQRLREQQGVTEGCLKIATLHTLSYYFVAEVMARFMTQRPHVNVTMSGRSSPDVVEMVDTGKADIGFVYDAAVASDGVEITFLFEVEMGFFVHEQSPLASLEEIDLYEHVAPLIVFPPQYALRRMLQTEGLPVTIAAEVDTVDAMLKLTSLTQGQCVLPDRIPDNLIEGYHLKRVRIVKPTLRRRIVAITGRGKMQSALNTLMLDIARMTAG